MSRLQESLFEGARMSLRDSLDLTAQSLLAYGSAYKHWAVAFSGGKDSSTTATIITHLIESGRVPAPQSLTFLYADTRLELMPLWSSAMVILDGFKARGYKTKIVLPALDDRYFVYMFGRGVPPPSNTFRWCTPQMKIEPMMTALKDLRDQTGEKFLMLTGVRVGESAARDQRIAVSCGKNGAECGQGWFQEATPESVADTLAPILHWRVCHVWDWLTFEAPTLGFPTQHIADAYGGEEAEEINARTGCVGCNLASRDTALDRVIRRPEWAYLTPLKRLKPLYAELKKPFRRLRKDGNERRKDGSLSANPNRLGPLTFEARMWGLGQILDIQAAINFQADLQDRPKISLINDEEYSRIIQLIEAETWPHGWSGDEVTGDIPMDATIAEGVIQPLLTGGRP
jgi:DNA sulfur modification protein DndC